MVDKDLFSLKTMKACPKMSTSAVIQGDCWRIGVLTDSLLRFEWADSGDFVDEASQMALNRDFGDAPGFNLTERDGLMFLETKYLQVTYDRRKFCREGLSITVKNVGSQMNTWHYGDEQDSNLHGTTSTLDGVDGSAALAPGLFSKNGWAVIDDSNSALIVETAKVDEMPNPFGTWIVPRTEGNRDFYFFGYGSRFTTAIRDFYHLSGPTPLLPRFVFGNWWSRYHRYRDLDYKQVVERFESEGIPLSVAVIDMDWHLVDIDDKYGSGWTGYTWNSELFPHPEAFLAWLHGKGLHTTLSDHPCDGVRAFEQAYPLMAKSLGIDPTSGESVSFDITSPRFMEAYFDLLHHPIEKQGIDFWWVDWQQGNTSRRKGLDPLWMLNHFHYLDSAHGGKRPLTFSRYAGPGSHRYPIGFSGDTVVSWDSLKFQPYFTSTASNIGYGWWSHDIGGHMFGCRDEQMQARWYQLGTFSPINRLHSTSSPFNGKEPWNFHPEARDAMSKSLRLRHQLIPYLYSMNRRAAYEGLPLVEPMQWQHANSSVPTEYLFGTELVVSPIVSAQDSVTQRGKTDVWLPQGQWFDFFDGRRYASSSLSGKTFQAWRCLDRIPVFAKAGAIVPLQVLDDDNGGPNSVENPKHLQLLLFPAAHGSFDLWEDDGQPEATNRWAHTKLSLQWNSREARCIIGAIQGESSVVPRHRHWEVIVRGIEDPGPGNLTVLINGSELDDSHMDGHVFYERKTLSLHLDLGFQKTSSEMRIILSRAKVAQDPYLHDSFKILQDAQMLYFSKERAYQMIVDEGKQALASFHSLEAQPGEYGEPQWFMSHIPQSVIDALTEVLMRV